MFFEDSANQVIKSKTFLSPDLYNFFILKNLAYHGLNTKRSSAWGNPNLFKHIYNIQDIQDTVILWRIIFNLTINKSTG